MSMKLTTTRDAVLHRAIGSEPHHQPSAVLGLDLAFERGEVLQHLAP
jgi:hypothetical protein